MGGQAMRLTAAIAATLVALAVGEGIYPDEHWNYSTELATDNADSFIKQGIDAGKTVFVRWIASEG